MKKVARTIALLGLLLTACGYKGPPLAGIEGLQYEIERYYRAHAAEENYTCLAPEMKGITRVQVLENTPERLVLAIRYHWVDSVYGIDDNGSSGVVSRRCNGFADRVFTIDRRDGVRVVDMSGPRRD